MSFTYDELKTAIKNYTQNQETSFVNNLTSVYTYSRRKHIKKRTTDPY